MSSTLAPPEPVPIGEQRTAFRPRTRPRPRVIASVVSTVMLALCATLLGPLGVVGTARADGDPCPGGAASGSGGEWCSSLRNQNLNAERQFPANLYRGDSRSPDVIFRDGFTARGSNNDLVNHVTGDRSLTSNYISTSGSQSEAERFARSQGQNNLATVAMEPRCTRGQFLARLFIPGIGPFLASQCQAGQITAHTYVYVIDPTWASNALNVVDQLERERPDLAKRYESQDEWAYVHHIPNYAIVGVRVYRMTAHESNGFLDLRRPITFDYESFVANPHHVAARVEYDPANDGYAHWGFDTDLISDDANGYTRGCNPITQCRG
ncbi:hypothetical protein [Streptomyces capitiformicae]|uniref:Uncharacterized protein n=1 Tax=Streptomyces capitiformicae TaxID=2014920 RepID=A0A919GBJ8_9ACTN|nr:hypothetical protein [Streptomyces capitiformicae]GHH81183.1 hypothetical protein GCM10017771_02400 [Streptomyces capitiformicae]